MNNGRFGTGNGFHIYNSENVSLSGCHAGDSQSSPTQNIGMQGQGSTSRVTVTGSIARGNYNDQIVFDPGMAVVSNNVTG